MIEIADNELRAYYLRLSESERPYFHRVINIIDVYDFNDLRAKIRKLRIDDIKQKQKMKAIPKEMTAGNFLRAEDIGEEAGDMKTGTIEEIDGDSVILVDNPFSKNDNDKKREQIRLSVQGVDDEKDFSLSPTNWNKLIELHGDDTVKWIGKKVGLVLAQNPVQKNKLAIVIRSAK